MKQAFKVSYIAPLGGYSETVWGVKHKVCHTEAEAVQFAQSLEAENKALEGRKLRSENSEICIDPTFIL